MSDDTVEFWLWYPYQKSRSIIEGLLEPHKIQVYNATDFLQDWI